MGYNKCIHLRQNIDAIRLALILDKERREATPEERSVLSLYSGFGGLKAILNPVDKPEDIRHWSKSETELFPLVAELHQVLREHSSTPEAYKQYIGSLKNSVLTAFYTPKPVVDILAKTLKESGIEPMRFLEPSAGTGAFIEAFKEEILESRYMAFEKDLLTGKILSHLYPDEYIRIEGYQKIENRYSGYFDVIASNIPFGDVAVFDPQFSNHKHPAVKQSTQAIHNYFFTKSVQTAREGGIIAFITSQGVLNSEQNKPVREYLMTGCNLVSAIRLPNNLFSDYAGTDVGSDLIILQRKSENTSLSPREQNFIESRKLSNGISINNLFRDFSRVVQTHSKVDTDPYGKPAIVFTHEGGIDGIARDLGQMLKEDFARHLDLRHYHIYTHQEEIKSAAQLDWEENPLGLEDVFSDEELEEIRLSNEQQLRSSSERYQPTQEDIESFSEFINESDQKLFSERPPLPECSCLNAHKQEQRYIFFRDYLSVLS